MMGFGSLQARSAEARSAMVTWKQKTQQVFYWPDHHGLVTLTWSNLKIDMTSFWPLRKEMSSMKVVLVALNLVYQFSALIKAASLQPGCQTEQEPVRVTLLSAFGCTHWINWPYHWLCTCSNNLKMATENSSCDTYKSITSGFPGLPISYDNSLLDISKHLEVFPQTGVGGVIRETPHKDLGERGVFLRRVHHVLS